MANLQSGILNLEWFGWTLAALGRGSQFGLRCLALLWRQGSLVASTGLAGHVLLLPIVNGSHVSSGFARRLPVAPFDHPCDAGRIGRMAEAWSRFAIPHPALKKRRDWRKMTAQRTAAGRTE